VALTSPQETLKPVRITRPHATGIRDPLKDPSVVEPPAPESRPPRSDPAPAAILPTEQGHRQGPREPRSSTPYRTRNGGAIQTFLLHVSKQEQKRRFLERLQNPKKNWKFSANDIKEREFCGEYMTAYEDTIRRTAPPDAPWSVVPADNKWFTRLVVAAAKRTLLGSR
jgi:Polyphosphate kinase 2 (PPK2)